MTAARCSACGRRAALAANSSLCQKCYRIKGITNAHRDGAHAAAAGDPDCPACRAGRLAREGAPDPISPAPTGPRFGPPAEVGTLAPGSRFRLVLERKTLFGRFVEGSVSSATIVVERTSERRFTTEGGREVVLTSTSGHTTWSNGTMVEPQLED